MRLSRNFFAGIALCVAPALSTSAFAAAFDFDATYDGVSVSWDGTGDNPIGTSLVPGDTFNYNFHAAGDAYWNVDIANDFFPFLAFTTVEAAERIGDISLSLLLDGVQQGSTLVENGIYNALVHLGTNTVSLDAGLMFDEIVMDYSLDTSFEDGTAIPVGTTISDFTIGPNIPGGFGEGISYVSEVPIPAAAWLFSSALLGLGVIKRRKA